MSDSFADLWASSTPVTQPAPPQKLGAVSAASSPNVSYRKPQHDVFSRLASAGSSAPNSRPLTPSSIGGLPPKSTPIMDRPPVKGGSGDAFSELLGGTIGASSNGTRLTIAERAAKVERERLEQIQKQQQQREKDASAWDGLDTLASSSSTSQLSSLTSPPNNGGFGTDDWAFDSPTATIHKSKPAQASQSKARAPIVDDDWGLGDFGTAASTIPASTPINTTDTRTSQSLWDLDDFTSTPIISTRKPPSLPMAPPSQRSSSPGNFDFGDREDRDSADEDDILGALSKPVDAIPKRPESLSVRPLTNPLEEGPFSIATYTSRVEIFNLTSQASRFELTLPHPDLCLRPHTS